jgi:hypothetical protein
LGLARELDQACLELAGALLGLVRAVAERRRLARLGEIQQDQDRQADDRGEACVRTHRADEVVDGESEW